MNSTGDTPPLLADNRVDWQAVAGYLNSPGIDDAARQKIERLAIASPYALHHLQREPRLIETLLETRQFSLDAEAIAVADENPADIDRLERELRLYRHRKLVEIIYRDVIEGDAIELTLRRLSDLAEQLVGAALAACNRQLSAKHGQPVDASGEPMQLDIIAMGKLGGGELNFSSDIDLICSFESDGELTGYGRLSYQEYFSRLVKLTSRVLGETTEDGFVYRVDLRLRPWGESGPVVLNHAALEHYYQLHGREWEQYAMVKARVISGSASSRKHLAALLKPFVYRRYHDYRVFEGLAVLKQKIDAQARSRGMGENIKLGPGGIREIEFFVQAFQILKGGRNHRLQSPSIFDCFEAFEDEDFVDRDTLATLREAYCFLRMIENRIQMYEDRQTHELPENPAQQARIAYGMGFDDWQALAARLRQHREQVNRVFRDLFRQESDSGAEPLIDDIFADGIEDDRQWDFVARSGVGEAAEINRQLNLFLHSNACGYMSARARQRFDKLLPELLGRIRSFDHPALLFERFMRLFSSISGRSVYFELLHQNPALLDRLSTLFASSAWIAGEVADYPMLLESLLQPGSQQGFDKSGLRQRLQRQLASVAGDTELELDTLRLFKREHILVIAGTELAREIDAMQAGRYISELAEVVLDAALELATRTLQAQYGRPLCRESGRQREAGFAIIGYGKLGGLEMHYQSDLDIIFLHDSDGEDQHTDGDKCIDNSVYFARLAQKVISMTSVLTASGKLYEIDSRLRPEGSKGLLVSTVGAYRRYQLEKAWTWEHQALVRARFVAGSPAIGEAFEEIRDQVLRLPREPRELRRAIVEMRERIYRAKRPPEGDRRDLKHSRGAMVDIEFLVQYWVLAFANKIGPGHLYSDNISLLKELFRLDLITLSQSRLVEIYTEYHRLLHESVLRDQSSEVDAGVIDEQLKQVVLCWNECFGLEN